jgi:phasin
VKRLAGRVHGLQVFSAVFTQTKVELLSSNGLLDGVVVAIELVADRRPNEVGAVGIKPLLHQEVDVAEVDIAEIDRDLLAISRFRPELVYLTGHFTIHIPSIWMVCGVLASQLQGESANDFDRRGTVSGPMPRQRASMRAITNSASSLDAKYYVALHHFCFTTRLVGAAQSPPIGNPALARAGAQGGSVRLLIDCPPDKRAPVSEAPTTISKPKLAKSTASTVSTSSPFELPKFDLPKFEVPNVEVPAAFREILEKGVSQAKDLNEKVKAAAAEAAHVVEETYTTVAQGSAEYNRKAVEAALSNADTFFDYALALLTAKSPTEIIKLSSAHLTQQFEAVTEQTKELSGLAHKLATETAEPLKTSITNVLKKVA